MIKRRATGRDSVPWRLWTASGAVSDGFVLPRVGVLTAVTFVLMMLSIPVPGGSTVHFSGVALLALSFGGWTAFLCVTLVLLMQATMFGVGGTLVDKELVEAGGGGGVAGDDDDGCAEVDEVGRRTVG